MVQENYATAIVTDTDSGDHQGAGQRSIHPSHACPGHLKRRDQEPAIRAAPATAPPKLLRAI
jgi:hypothetical protein